MIIVIAAIAENNVIGNAGDLPWHLKSDLLRFKTLTQNGTVVMGRKTHESIIRRMGKPLPNRTSIVLSRDTSYHANGVVVCHSLKAAFDMCTANVFIIGGERVFREAVLLADELRLTIVHAKPEGDVRFPSPLPHWFIQTNAVQFPKDADNEHDYTFSVHQRRVNVPARSFVCLSNARKPHQWATMERIELDGVCPFCPEHLSKYHTKPIIRENNDWVLTENQWPYPNAQLHLIVIAKKHWERLEHVPARAWQTLGELLTYAEQNSELSGGGLGLRFGNPVISGSTVRHLHAQLISPRRGAKSIPFYIGTGRW